jgi:hypothetical protein
LPNFRVDSARVRPSQTGVAGGRTSPSPATLLAIRPTVVNLRRALDQMRAAVRNRPLASKFTD